MVKVQEGLSLERLADKFNGAVEKIDGTYCIKKEFDTITITITGKGESYTIGLSDVLGNTKMFRYTCMKLAKRITDVGKVACYSYGAAVYCIMKNSDIDAKAFVGIAVEDNVLNYQKIMKELQESNTGIAPNHIWIKCNFNETSYENFNNEYDAITHVAFREISK